MIVATRPEVLRVSRRSSCCQGEWLRVWLESWSERRLYDSLNFRLGGLLISVVVDVAVRRGMTTPDNIRNTYDSGSMAEVSRCLHTENLDALYSGASHI